MEKIYDETFDSGRHLWYRNVPLSEQAKFGLTIALNASTVTEIIDRLSAERVHNQNIFAYFYDQNESGNAITESFRISLMVKINESSVNVRFNLSDLDFAEHLQEIQGFEKMMIEKLTEEFVN
ncbi:DUF871 domain-containing protein [Lactococcus fujiensis]|nr:DUF871 domain-containing protein [Lactococcus fujiensis]